MQTRHRGALKIQAAVLKQYICRAGAAVFEEWATLYKYRVPRRSPVEVFRILALLMTGVLLQTSFLAPNCMPPTPRELGAARIQASKDCPDDPDGEDGCCSFCFCCHFAGITHSADLSVPLDASGYLQSGWRPLPSQWSFCPVDQPPRA
jgi:hypothetical protein